LETAGIKIVKTNAIARKIAIAPVEFRLKLSADFNNETFSKSSDTVRPEIFRLFPEIPFSRLKTVRLNIFVFNAEKQNIFFLLLNYAVSF